MLVHRRVTPSVKFAGTHLYTQVERGTVKVKCLGQEHNTMSPRTGLEPRTARSRDKRTNHEATAPPIMYLIIKGIHLVYYILPFLLISSCARFANNIAFILLSGAIKNTEYSCSIN